MRALLESLTDRLGAAIKRISSRGQLSEADLDDALRQVRIALLEADVHFLVVKDFIADLRKNLAGARIADSLTPAQTVVKAVHQALVDLLTGPVVTVPGSGPAPRRILLVGLQGAGKSSLAQKLAAMLSGQGLRPILAAADLARAAAVEQLVQLGNAISVPVVTVARAREPLAVVQAARIQAERGGYDPLIVDSAGRTDLNQPLLAELVALHQALDPTLCLLVADAMTGQSAVDVARTFANAMRVDGVVLTKMDGDARGGAALSMRQATGLPVVLMASGEGPTALERFHPDRLASRILGMGDMLTLIERAERASTDQASKQVADSLRKGTLTYDDLLIQIRQVTKMGSMEELIGMIPGLNRLRDKVPVADPQQIRRLEAVILSMTPAERAQPQLLNGRRKRRIALGAGVEVALVNRLAKQLEEMQRLAKWGRKPHLPGGLGGLQPPPLPRSRARSQ
ncbi:MAG: signal recognition particle protein [Sulfobacillus sp.]